MAQRNVKGKISPPESVELVLGGGGIKGFGHIGFLKAIEEKQVVTGKVTGVSIGSAAAAFYTNGYSPDEFTEIFLREIANLSPVKGQRGVMVRDMLRGGINLKRKFHDITVRYKLRPREELRILAFNVLNGKPVLFEGTNYDLPTALAASCSVPGVMRPVWFGQDNVVGTIIKGWRGKTTEGILVDGGLHHPAPGHFCQGPAIISKLGIANSLPAERLSPTDLVFHVLEMSAHRLVEWYFPDPKNHLVVKTGMPNVAALTFGLSEELCLEMIDYAYRRTVRDLEPVIRSGRVPVKSGK
jgi:hypothetical protein